MATMRWHAFMLPPLHSADGNFEHSREFFGREEIVGTGAGRRGRRSGRVATDRLVFHKSLHDKFLSYRGGGRPIIAEMQLLARSYDRGSFDRDLRRPAQIQRALLRASGRSRAPFDCAVDGAPHLVEPPGGAGTEHLAAAPGRALAGGGSGAEGKVELTAGIFGL